MDVNQPVTPAPPAPGSPARVVTACLLLGIVAAATWFAWLGWDHEYHEVDGVPQGPYRAWQVIGCAVTIAVAAGVAQVFVRRFWAVVPLAAAGVVGFAVPWAVDAAATDDSGLWVVGLLFLLCGGGGALLALLVVTASVTHSGAGRRLGHDGRP